ncbi:MAG: IPTL-CTERM sorting domain-containing protein [Candidatus Kapaibacterium sp.]
MKFSKLYILVLLIATPLFSQYQIKKSTTSAGGGKQTNSSNTLYHISGQPIGNSSSNSQYLLREGYIFYYLGDEVVQLSDEPLVHSDTFTLDSILDAGSIRFNIQPAEEITNAAGYIVLAKVNADPDVIVSDANYPSLYYSSNGTKVVSILTDITADKITATGLQPSMTYTFTLIPFNWNGSDDESINFKTDGIIPKITQTTPIPTLSEWALILLGVTIPIIVYFKMKA